MQKLLTKREIAEALGMSTRSIDRYRAMGLDMGVVRIGKSVRFSLDRVQMFIDAGEFTKRQGKRRHGAK